MATPTSWRNIQFSSSDPSWILEISQRVLQRECQILGSPIPVSQLRDPKLVPVTTTFRDSSHQHFIPLDRYHNSSPSTPGEQSNQAEQVEMERVVGPGLLISSLRLPERPIEERILRAPLSEIYAGIEDVVTQLRSVQSVVDMAMELQQEAEYLP